jgi:hypothetical protein
MRDVGIAWPAPTGTAFDDALDWLQVSEQLGVPLLELERRAWVMHGICLSPVSDEPFAHAWVHLRERPSVVLATPTGDGDDTPFGLVYFEASQRAFDVYFRPQLVTRYTVRECIEQNALHEHYGPWLPEYIELCTPR